MVRRAIPEPLPAGKYLARCRETSHMLAIENGHEDVFPRATLCQRRPLAHLLPRWQGSVGLQRELRRREFHHRTRAIGEDGMSNLPRPKTQSVTHHVPEHLVGAFLKTADEFFANARGMRTAGPASPGGARPGLRPWYGFVVALGRSGCRRRLCRSDVGGDAVGPVSGRVVYAYAVRLRQ